MKKLITILLTLLPLLVFAQKVEYVAEDGMFRKVITDTVNDEEIIRRGLTLLDSSAVQGAVYGTLTQQYEMVAKKSATVFEEKLKTAKLKDGLNNIGKDNYDLYMKIYLDKQLNGKYFLEELDEFGHVVKDYNVTLTNWQLMRGLNVEFDVQPKGSQFLIISKPGNSNFTFSLAWSNDRNAFVGENNKGEFIIMTKKN